VLLKSNTIAEANRSNPATIKARKNIARALQSEGLRTSVSLKMRARHRSLVHLTVVPHTRLRSRRPNHPTSKQNLPAVRPVSIRPPGRGTARRCAGNSREGRARGRFQPDRRISSPLYESAPLSMGRSFTPPTAPRPATNDWARHQAGPDQKAHIPIFPKVILSQKAAFPGAEMRRWARISAAVVRGTLCVSENTLANSSPFPARNWRRALHDSLVCAD
jgi:hypothetical protein